MVIARERKSQSHWLIIGISVIHLGNSESFTCNSGSLAKPLPTVFSVIPEISISIASINFSSSIKSDKMNSR